MGKKTYGVRLSEKAHINANSLLKKVIIENLNKEPFVNLSLSKLVDKLLLLALTDEDIFKKIFRG